jgi:hypothetical protein
VCALCLDVLLSMRRERSSFIGGEEGALWKMNSPLKEGSKLPSNRPEDAMNLAGYLCNRLCNIGESWPTESSMFGVGN